MAVNLPARLTDLRELWAALNWDELSLAVQREAGARLAIVGPVNSGKSTLFNLIEGRKISAVTAVPGTTRGVVEERIGPFVLVDTPGFGEVGGVNRAEIARHAADRADVIVLLLDLSAGLRQSDYDVYQSLRATGVPVIVAANKIDLVKRDLAPILRDIEEKLGVAPVPISAKTGVGVGERLIPAIVNAHPWIAVALGRALPSFRHVLAGRVIRSAAALNGIIAVQPVPVLDVPLLLAGQVRMVLRIAAIYGESLSVSHARELLTTIAGGVALRFLATELAKVIPGPGWLVSGVVAGLGTWAIGQVAMTYFEEGKRLTPAQLRERYRRLHRKPRQALEEEEKVAEEPVSAEVEESPQE